MAPKKKEKVAAPVVDETVSEPTVKEVQKNEGEGKVYTYIGGGEDSPHRIHFMGIQHFKRGEATEVTHPEVLAKLANHPTFVEGEVNPDDLDEYDSSAKNEADKKRLAEKAINAAWQKKHNKE